MRISRIAINGMSRAAGKAALAIVLGSVTFGTIDSSILVHATEAVWVEPPSNEPKVIPQDREELKKSLDQLKGRKSRLPLPEVPPGTVGSNGKIIVNNGLARRTYLPEAWFAADFGNDPAMTLTYVYKTQCFWVVSRGNNCHYCLGHQEHKLHDAGLSDRQIALLDYDWKQLDPMLQKGVQLAKQMTLSPHSITSKDIEALRPDLTDPQIIDLVYTIAMFNSVNRWTDALGIPQDQRFRDKVVDFSTPVDDEFKGKAGGKAAITKDEKPRVLPSFADAMEELKLASTRQPRVALPSEAETRKLLSLPEEQKTVQDWERALATFPQVGRKQLDGLRSMESEGHLSPKIKAIIAWTSARNNHAIATLAVAKKRFEKLGISEADMAAIDQGNNLEPQEKLVALFAAKLTSHPQKITDQDIEQLREHFTDQQTAEIVYLIGAANMLDRLTETLGLRAL